MNNNRINIGIDRPEIDITNKRELRECARTLANDLTEQIMEQLISYHHNEHVKYWNKLIKQWETERVLMDRKHSKLREIKAARDKLNKGS